MTFATPTWVQAAVWFEGQMALIAGMLLTIAISWQGVQYMLGKFDHDRWLAILIGGGMAAAGRGFWGWLLS